MQRGGVKAHRDKSLCAQLSSLSVSDWVGTVKTIDSNSDGKGVLAVSLAPDITVQTWNNELSDIGSDTLIQPGTQLFASASAMKTGDLVRFSGTFLPGAEGDCLEEASLTLEGKVESPDFIFRFSGITPYTVAQSPHNAQNSQSASQQPAADNANAEQPAESPDNQNANSDARAEPPSGQTPQPEPSPESTTQAERSSGPSRPAAAAGVTTQENLQTITAGNAQQPQDAYQPAEADTKRIVVSGDLIASNRIGGVVPRYPAVAKAARIQGTVVFQAMISKEGTIQDLRVLSGPPMLQEAAIDAVRTWRYKPYLLNGEPVAVETQVNVIFTLGG